MLLQLGGWRVHQAVGTEDALRLAALTEPDLVVTDMVMRNGHGATLMRRLREQGSTARFLVVAARRTHQTLALASGAGALACLAKPVDPRLFVDVMLGMAPAAAPAPSSGPVRAAMPDDVGPRAAEMYLSALPHRLSAIAAGAQAGRCLSRRAGRGGAGRGERPPRARRGRVRQFRRRAGRPARDGHARTAGEAGGALRAARSARTRVRRSGDPFGLTQADSSGQAPRPGPLLAPRPTAPLRSLRSSLAGARCDAHSLSAPASLRCSRSCPQAATRR